MAKRQGTVFIDKKPPTIRQKVLPEVRKEVVSEDIKTSVENKRKLESLVTNSKRIIYRAKAVWPFDFFRSEVIIDENKLDIINKLFFHSAITKSLNLNTMSTANITTDLFFGSLIINIEASNESPMTIKYLKKKDAIRIRRILAGLIACKKEGIDLSKFDIDYVRKKVEEIGRTRTR